MEEKGHERVTSDERHAKDEESAQEIAAAGLLALWESGVTYDVGDDDNQRDDGAARAEQRTRSIVDIRATSRVHK